MKNNIISKLAISAIMATSLIGAANVHAADDFDSLLEMIGSEDTATEQTVEDNNATDTEVDFDTETNDADTTDEEEIDLDSLGEEDTASQDQAGYETQTYSDEAKIEVEESENINTDNLQIEPEDTAVNNNGIENLNQADNLAPTNNVGNSKLTATGLSDVAPLILSLLIGSGLMIARRRKS